MTDNFGRPILMPENSPHLSDGCVLTKLLFLLTHSYVQFLSEIINIRGGVFNLQFSDDGLTLSWHDLDAVVLSCLWQRIGKLRILLFFYISLCTVP